MIASSPSFHSIPSLPALTREIGEPVRDNTNETAHSPREGSDPVRDWFRWDYVSDSDRRKQPGGYARVLRTGRYSVTSWIDCNRAWSAYRASATIVYCGLTGTYIGQLLNYAIGIR